MEISNYYVFGVFSVILVDYIILVWVADLKLTKNKKVKQILTCDWQRITNNFWNGPKQNSPFYTTYLCEVAISPLTIVNQRYQSNPRSIEDTLFTTVINSQPSIFLFWWKGQAHLSH